MYNYKENNCETKVTFEYSEPVIFDSQVSSKYH